MRRTNPAMPKRPLTMRSKLELLLVGMLELTPAIAFLVFTHAVVAAVLIAAVAVMVTTTFAYVAWKHGCWRAHPSPPRSTRAVDLQ